MSVISSFVITIVINTAALVVLYLSGVPAVAAYVGTLLLSALNIPVILNMFKEMK